MNQEDFGKLLKSYIANEKNTTKIARWVFKIYSENLRDLDPNMTEILECLFSMEDDPQFEYTEDELKILADMLIRGETEPIKKINEFVSNKQIGKLLLEELEKGYNYQKISLWAQKLHQAYSKQFTPFQNEILLNLAETSIKKSKKELVDVANMLKNNEKEHIKNYLKK